MSSPPVRIFEVPTQRVQRRGASAVRLSVMGDQRVMISSCSLRQAWELSDCRRNKNYGPRRHRGGPVSARPTVQVVRSVP